MASESKEKDLKSVLAAINKEFGAGAIMSLGEFSETEIECIPTGSIGLDVALGGKGVPRGRIIEINGIESGGKTTVALHIAANTQKMGGNVAYIDVENALDGEWAKKIGVDMDKMHVSQPSYGEEALQIAEMLIKSGAFDLVVIDSVATLVPKTEIENDIGQPTMGLQARLMSQALRVLNPAISKSNTCVIFINQIRHKIGGYGNPETTPGGLSLKFYASVRIELRPTKDTDTDAFGDISAKGVKAKIIKNKIAPPLRTAEFYIRYDSGIDGNLDILKHAVEMDVVTKGKGAFYTYGDLRIGHGESQASDFLASNPKIRDTIHIEVLERYKNRVPGEAKPEKEEQLD